MDDITTLFIPGNDHDPYSLYARLREHSPVVKAERIGIWALTRYEDVVFALKHPKLFSSATSEASKKSMVQDPRLQESLDTMMGTSLVSSDPPRHTRLRKLINLAFTPRAITRLEGRIRSLVTELVDDILRRDQFDLIEDFAIPLPVIVISEMLGVDPARRADFKRWSDDLLASSRFTEHEDEAEIERLLRSNGECVDYFREMIEVRRREPRDDLLGDLVRAEVEREILSPGEVLSMAVLLLLAGNETTTNLIGNGMAEILEHPEQLRRLRADPSLIPGFLEEVLRHCSPVTMLVRTTTEAITIRGVTIPEGELVALFLAAANRDPEQFPEPDRFDITRKHTSQLAFGHGIHFCVGAPLSRLEGRLAFEELFARLPEFSRVPGSLDWIPNANLHGLRTLPLRFDRPAPARERSAPAAELGR